MPRQREGTAYVPRVPGVCLAGRASETVRRVLTGPRQRAGVLGAGRHALYLRTRSGQTVIGVVTRDAVRVPCTIVLPVSSEEMPLTSVAPSSAPGDEPVIGGGSVRWTSSVGEIRVDLAGWWSPPHTPRGLPSPTAVAMLAQSVETVAIGVPPAYCRRLAAARSVREQHDAAVRLLGRGPGLTPSGDDLLTGFLTGSMAFGVAAPGVCGAVRSCAADATTALSAQLLGHALQDELVPPLADLLCALLGEGQMERALRALLSVGHTSGAALGLGVLLAARPSAGVSHTGHRRRVRVPRP